MAGTDFITTSKFSKDRRHSVYQHSNMLFTNPQCLNVPMYCYCIRAFKNWFRKAFSRMWPSADVYYVS